MIENNPKPFWIEHVFNALAISYHLLNCDAHSTLSFWAWERRKSLTKVWYIVITPQSSIEGDQGITLIEL